MKKSTSTSAMLRPEQITKPISIPVAYGNWLNTMQWDFFCTFSTRYPLSVNSARKAMERLHSYVQSTHPKCRLFWAAEPFDSKESYHAHGLISFSHPPTKKTEKYLKTSWQVVSSGRGGKEYNHTVIRPYIPDLGAHFYVGKYIDRPNAEYGFLF